MNRQVLRWADRSIDITGVNGPEGSLQFGPEELSGVKGPASFTPNFQSEFLAALDQCLGARLFQESVEVRTAAAQVTTVDFS